MRGTAELENELERDFFRYVPVRIASRYLLHYKIKVLNLTVTVTSTVTVTHWQYKCTCHVPASSLASYRVSAT